MDRWAEEAEVAEEAEEAEEARPVETRPHESS